MDNDHTPENVLSAEEASEVIVEATETSAEEIRRGTEEIEAVPPEEAEIIVSDSA